MNGLLEICSKLDLYAATAQKNSAFENFLSDFSSASESYMRGFCEKALTYGFVNLDSDGTFSD